MQIKLHHVAIVAKNEEQIEQFKQALCLNEERRERLEKYKVTNIFLSAGQGAAIQFMLPDEGTTLKNFNQGKGGLHHIAFCTPDLSGTQKELQAKGLNFISPEKEKGIGNYEFNFIHPNLAGINVELIEDPDMSWRMA